jgi:hypothetical protein
MLSDTKTAGRSLGHYADVFLRLRNGAQTLEPVLPTLFAMSRKHSIREANLEF